MSSFISFFWYRSVTDLEKEGNLVLHSGRFEKRCSRVLMEPSSSFLPEAAPNLGYCKQNGPLADKGAALRSIHSPAYDRGQRDPKKD